MSVQTSEPLKRATSPSNGGPPVYRDFLLLRSTHVNQERVIQLPDRNNQRTRYSTVLVRPRTELNQLIRVIPRPLRQSFSVLAGEDMAFIILSIHFPLPPLLPSTLSHIAHWARIRLCPLRRLNSLPRTSGVPCYFAPLHPPLSPSSRKPLPCCRIERGSHDLPRTGRERRRERTRQPEPWGLINCGRGVCFALAPPLSGGPLPRNASIRLIPVRKPRSTGPPLANNFPLKANPSSNCAINPVGCMRFRCC